MSKSFIKSLVIHSYDQYKNATARTDQKWLFIIGHMRSGSSLLLHLLINHPQLLGQGESNASYIERKDLYKLELKSRLSHRSFFQKYTFFVDQINHNKFTPNFEFLNESLINFVFLVRAPFVTVTSILNMSDHFYEGKWSKEMAINYYCERLDGMTQLYESTDDKTKIAVLKYESLITNPEKELTNIQHILDLSTPFSTNYEVYKFTGKRGDPGKAIQQQKIVKNVKPILDFSIAETKKLMHAYNRCLKTLNL